MHGPLHAPIVALGKKVRVSPVVSAMKLLSGLIALGLIVAALVTRGPRESPAPARGNVITMGHEAFGRSVVTIHTGEHLTFYNTSQWLHVLIPGTEARQQSGAGMPSFGSRDAHVIEHGDRWTTGAWNTPGTYYITCQLHPEMTLEVRVLPRTTNG
jgi:plastocyanin